MMAADSIHTGRFVAYYRVSTTKQGKSGLGREAQEASVGAYLNGGRWKAHCRVCGGRERQAL
jgi:DNA invertase Pin-like site-specific DNA recombinase